MLGRKSPKRILEFFLDNPSKEMRMTDIIAATGLAKLSVMKWTKELAKHKFFSTLTIGRTNLYSLNKGNPSVRQFRVLYNVDYVNGKIGEMEEGVQVFLYGSFARGENMEKSDIDLLVIGKNRDVIRKLRKMDTRIKVSFYTPIEWSMTSRKDKTFFENVEKDKIRLR